MDPCLLSTAKQPVLCHPETHHGHQHPWLLLQYHIMYAWNCDLCQAVDSDRSDSSLVQSASTKVRCTLRDSGFCTCSECCDLRCFLPRNVQAQGAVKLHQAAMQPCNAAQMVQQLYKDISPKLGQRRLYPCCRFVLQWCALSQPFPTR